MVSPRSIIKNLFGFSVVPIATALVTIAIIPVISNVFPAEDYGKINLFYSVGMLLATCLMLGLDNALIRYFYDAPAGLTGNGIQFLALVVGIGLDMILGVGVAVAAWAPASILLFGEPNRLVMPLLCLFTAALLVFRLLNTNARMNEDYRRYNLQSVLQMIITRIAFVVVALYSTDYLWSVGAMTLGMVVLSSLFLIVQRRTFSIGGCVLGKSNLQKVLSFGLPVMATNLVLSLNGVIGKLALGSAGLFQAVGVFAIATTLSNVFTVVPAAFATYWSPFMYKNYRTEQVIITKAHDYVMLAATLIVIAIILLQDVLFSVVGAAYRESQAYFMVIMLSPIQALICETTAYGITLKERPIYNVLASLVGVAISASVTVWLMGSLGAMAAALGVGVGALFVGIARSVIGQHYYVCVESPGRTIAVAALITLLCAANGLFVGSLSYRYGASSIALACVMILYRRQARSSLRLLLTRR